MKLFRKTRLSSSIGIGEQIYYPSHVGMALLGTVVEKSEDDIVVEVAGDRYYVPNDEFDSHAVRLSADRHGIFVSYSTADPDNRIVYLRFVYTDTIVDRLYNWYCRFIGRKSVVEINKKPPGDTRGLSD